MSVGRGGVGFGRGFASLLVFQIPVGGFAAVGDESPTYQLCPDTGLVSLGSCDPRSPKARDRGHPDSVVGEHQERQLQIPVRLVRKADSLRAGFRLRLPRLRNPNAGPQTAPLRMTRLMVGAVRAIPP